MGYKRDTIIRYCEERLEDPSTFYKKDRPTSDGKIIKRNDIINYRGICTDTKEYYTEVIAEFLCSHIDIFRNGIKKAERKEYKVDGHDCEKIDTDRTEEGIAMKMRKYCEDDGEFNYIGKILDYQVPLKSSNRDKGLGKIDLISYNEDLKTMYILELKKPDSKETMLRCVLEGFTYMETIKNKEKFLEDFDCPKGTSIKASPFVFAGKESNPYMEMKEERPWLKKLMELLNSKSFYILETENGYKIEEEIK